MVRKEIIDIQMMCPYQSHRFGQIFRTQDGAGVSKHAAFLSGTVGTGAGDEDAFSFARPCLAKHQPGGIGVGDGIVEHIGVVVEALAVGRLAQGIRGQEAGDDGVPRVRAFARPEGKLRCARSC